LTGGHVAVSCAECHKQSDTFQPKPTAQYHWPDLACASCHQDPHNGQFAEKMRQSGKDGKPMGCQACHSTKTWKDLTAFDHDKTAFPLSGSHKAVGCIDCHKPPNFETKIINVDFKSAPTKCEECHEDPHGKQFAKNAITSCGECHNTAKWKPSLFDHETRTSFPLQGAHRNVSCESCHKAHQMVEGKPVLFYKPTPKACADCHGTKF
jgi:predicted CXXCH cytochrome family protein